MPESGLVGGRFREIRQIISDGPRSLIECIDKLDVNNRRVLISRFNDVNYKHQKEIVSEGNRIYKTLRSSHLLELNESFDNDVEIFQIFTFPEGIKSLDTALVKTPYLFILRIIKDLCLFVDEAHAAGFFISFLNPRHLFIAKSGDLKILDTSYFIKNPKSSISLPLPDTIFIAPELFKTLRPTTASDVYSLAMSVCFLMSGLGENNISFSQLDREKTTQKLLSNVKKRYSDQALLNTLKAALSATPGSRPTTVKKFLKEISPIKKISYLKAPKRDNFKFTSNTVKISLPFLKMAMKNTDSQIINTLSFADIKRAVSNAPSSKKMEIMLLLCRIWSLGGTISKMDYMEGMFKAACSTEKQREELLYYRALRHYTDRKWNEAKKELDKILSPNSLVLNLYGMIYQKNGDLGNGVSSYNEAVRVAISEGNRLDAMVYKANLASLFQAMGKYDDALRLYFESLAGFRKIRNKKPLANIFSNIAGLLAFFGDFDSALRNLNKSDQLVFLYGLKRQEGLNHLLHAEIYKFLGLSDKQETSAKKALEIFTDFNDQKLILKALIKLGWCSLRSGNSDRVKEIIVHIQALLNKEPSSEDPEYRLLHVCYLRRFLRSAALHMLDLLNDEPCGLRNNIPLYYEWNKLKAYVFHDIGDLKNSKKLLRETKEILNTLTNFIPKSYRKLFKSFMENERIIGQLRIPAYTKEQRRKTMAFNNKLPWIYESFTRTLKMIMERIPSSSQHQMVLKDLIRLTGACAAVSFCFENGKLLPTIKVGDIDSEILAKIFQKKMENTTKYKIISLDSKKHSTAIVAPVSLGREKIGYLAVLFSAEAKDNVTAFGELIQSYADLIGVIDLSVTREASDRTPNNIGALPKQQSQRTSFIFGESAVMKNIKQRIQQTANIRSNFIIYGEGGTGKRTLAEHIHFVSSPEMPIEIVDCRGSDDEYFYREFFGSNEEMGVVGRACNGTIVLLHIERLSWEMQNHILCLTNEKTFRPYASRIYKKASPRLIATTYEKFWEATDNGLLNNQLVKFLGGYKLNIVPLSQRINDIEAIVKEYLLSRHLKIKISDDFLAKLMTKTWSYNTAELFRVIDGAVSLASKNELSGDLLPDHIKSTINPTGVTASFGTLTEILRENERKVIEESLERYAYDKEKTCRALGISKPNLYKKMQMFNLLTEKVTREQLVAAIKACDGNKQQAAKQLGISRRTLYNKLTEYHIKA